ncbi:hypothetical protein RIF29_00853 [Crotalaria pallida]|uniref:Uncharacterized protein n=1 Tax=Crotalaria pallida TaxID=3830 RepID=A0AAN9IWD3_CROPI
MCAFKGLKIPAFCIYFSACCVVLGYASWCMQKYYEIICSFELIELAVFCVIVTCQFLSAVGSHLGFPLSGFLPYFLKKKSSFTVGS